MRGIVFATLTAGALAIGGPAPATPQPDAPPTAAAKKRCKIVKKHIHGRIKKIRVCTKPKPPLPSKVTVTLDSAHATTASIGADAGATLTAGAATLTVPAGAVAQTTTVTMTPVSKLGGLNGRIAGAFEFKPDGLQLLKPVTLTIDVTSPSGLEAFTYTGNGTDFHLYPVKVEGGKATLDLIHFSGYGVGEGLPQPAVARVRQFLTGEVKPLIAQAKGNSRLFAVAALRTWELLLEMARLPTDDFVELYPDFQAVQADLGLALRRLADDQHTKCVETHDIVGTAKETEYNLVLVVPLLFIKSQPLADAVSYAREQVKKCESFELDFDSTTTGVSNTEGGHSTSHVRVQGLPLNGSNNWNNAAVLDYVQFEFGPQQPPCAFSWSVHSDAAFTASLVGFAADPSAPIVMNVFGGGATEIVTLTCPDGGTTLPPAHFWQSVFTALHQGQSFTIGGWDHLGGAVYARKTYKQTESVPDGSISEETTFVLRHTPQ